MTFGKKKLFRILGTVVVVDTRGGEVLLGAGV